MRDPNQRRNTLRVILFMIILGTLPFYLLGFWLWGTAPSSDPVTATPSATTTPLGADRTPTEIPPTRTLRPTNTQRPDLINTPVQFLPPVVIPTNTQVPVIIPTTTPAPTLTPILPTATNVPPTNVPPTNPPPPTDPPPPTATEGLPFLPTNTLLPPVVLPPPSDTPQGGG